MKYYFAPMEGVTGYIYRNAHHTFFNHIDKYFTPFIVPTQSKKLTTKELNDVLPEHNQDMYVVPQILTNRGEDFVWTARKLEQLGYKEINLNLGCPSGTVVSKKRGSGFLACTDELDLFLDQIFSEVDMKISIKTRIGKDDPEEFHNLLQIYNKYPMEELIIHPRIQKDYYKNKPNWSVFEEALLHSKNPVCYNGDIFTAEDYQNLMTAFPDTKTVMLGRGLIANPGLIGMIQTHMGLDKKRLREFHDTIFREYREYLSGEKPALYKMKEIWSYMIFMFSNSDKYAKKIRKVERISEYEAIVSGLFAECELVKDGGFMTKGG